MPTFPVQESNVGCGGHQTPEVVGLPENWLGVDPTPPDQGPERGIKSGSRRQG
jgi:hypothetical protein